ncbi:DUF6879 family protein [Actinokineospora sp. HUAS TT18]|uniref:DUF6879 family protein n=1 Tax=Actinokineospora sp. HUAS TT18 TaxID=3447451 RepID=UPI003F5262C5
MRLGRDGSRDLFRTYRRSAWRFETQPTYTIPGEADSLARFLAGQPEPAHEPRYVEWLELTRASVAAGKSIGRVKVVRRPFTDYTRYAFAWGIPHSVEHGEDIRILDATDLSLDLPSDDFWLFDDTEVLHLTYGADGKLISRELLADPPIENYRRWQRIALEHSVPFGDYVRS